jgi:hypothetical protein
MRERLETFMKLCEDYERDHLQTTDYTFRKQELSDEMAPQEPTVKEILKRLDPKLARSVTEPDYTGGAHDSLRAVQKGLGILRDQDEWKANLAPDTPSFVADQFHPHVWAAVSGLWETGRYRVAVGQAAVALSAHIASKARSSLTERELVQQVFAPGEPGPTRYTCIFRAINRARSGGHAKTDSTSSYRAAVSPDESGCVARNGTELHR